MAKIPLWRRRELQRAAILAACQKLIADGTYPSGKLLHALVPDTHIAVALKIRNDLHRGRLIDYEGTSSGRRESEVKS